MQLLVFFNTVLEGNSRSKKATSIKVTDKYSYSTLVSKQINFKVKFEKGI